MPHIPVILHQLTGTVELPEASSGGSLLTEACQCAANSLNAPVEHFSVKSVEFEDGQHLGSNAISGYSVGELAQRKAVVNVMKSQGPAADVMQQLQEHMRALAVAVRTNQERTAASVAGLQESFASLESSHANLQRDHNNLQRDYNNLQRDHSNLKTQAQQAEKTNESRYQQLEQYCQKLQRQKQDEENSNEQLQQRYESLQASRTEVEAQCKSLEKSVSKLLWRCHSIALRVLVDAARQEINGGELTPDQKKEWNNRVNELSESDLNALKLSKEAVALTKYSRDTKLPVGKGNAAAHVASIAEVADAVTAVPKGEGRKEHLELFEYVYGMAAEQCTFSV